MKLIFHAPILAAEYQHLERFIWDLWEFFSLRRSSCNQSGIWFGILSELFLKYKYSMVVVFVGFYYFVWVFLWGEDEFISDNLSPKQLQQIVINIHNYGQNCSCCYQVISSPIQKILLNFSEGVCQIFWQGRFIPSPQKEFFFYYKLTSLRLR